MKLLILLITFSLSIVSNHTFAEINSLSQAINESGRLRMLSQRIAKAYLLKTMDVQPEKADKQYYASLKKFEQNLSDLKAFNSENHSSASVEISLSIIEKQWLTYKTELEKPIKQEAVFNILALSDKTLSACEELVKQLENIAQRQSAKWVNISGRQRMLSQRIAKFYSAISLEGINADYDAGLQLAIEQFESALQQLIASPDNTHFVNHKLRKVQTQWNFSKQGFKQLTKGASTPLVIFMTTESILRQMNDITALYEEIDSNKKKNAITG